MSNPGKSHLYPTAPAVEDVDDFHRGAPPPSYEESLRMTGPAAAPAQPCYGNGYYQQHTQQQAHFPGQSTSFSPPPNTPYGYQAHIPQQQIYYNAGTPTSTQMSPSHNVLVFDKRAKIRTNENGAVTVPPPPPGCAPTPAQLAAMSGQQVMVKQKKKFFF